MLKKNWFLKLIIWELAIKSVLLFFLSMGLFSLMNKDLGILSTQLAADLNLDVDKHYINLLLSKVGMVKTHLIVEVSIGLFLYGTLSGIQAYGLHKRRRWAEYLTVAALSLFIPFEIYGIIDQLSLVRVSVLALNCFIIYYLMKHTELFPSTKDTPPKRTALPLLNSLIF